MRMVGLFAVGVKGRKALDTIVNAGYRCTGGGVSPLQMNRFAYLPRSAYVRRQSVLAPQCASRCTVEVQA